MQRRTTGIIIAATLAAVAGAALSTGESGASSPAGSTTPVKTTKVATSTTTKPATIAAKPFELSCDEGTETKGSTPVRVHDESIRASAQKGLDFLTDATVAWQEQRNCMGCHVQGVTGEALSVGTHHQYEIDDRKMKTVFTGILDLSGGIRSEEGHARPGGSLRPSARAYGGASLARYDMWVGEEYGDDLIDAATDLLEHQLPSGEIEKAHVNPPVSKGPLQATYQAIQTWQQAYARSADDRWLTAIAKAEGYIQKHVDGWQTNDLQHVNYALLGLLEAGIGSTETLAVELREKLLQAQAPDGGFPLSTGGGTSSPLATGQTLYTLRRLGMNDSDEAVKNAVMFLVEAQKADGGWSHSGAAKAEAMWAVLGLVSTDVLSVNVSGVENGQRIEGKQLIEANAVDNEGSGVKQIEIAVDDIRVWGSCSSRTAYTLDAADLEDGMHTIDVTAINADGRQARRRLIVYAGDHYLVNVGTRYSDGGTLLSFRDIAPESFDHVVELTVLKDGKEVDTLKQTGEQGPASFHWKGDESGEYTARLRVEDAAGETRQIHEMPFVHDTPEAQAARYAGVSGKINFAGDDADVQNAVVELVDEKGNVVQRTRSTASGQYRFRNVQSKRKYRVRVKKKGWADREAELAPAAAAEESQADFEL